MTERLLRISVEVVPHSQQRYPTVGDWQWAHCGAVLMMRVSRMSDQRHEWLVLVHELVEALLCRNFGITQEDVDKFDIQYEDTRELLLREKGLTKAEKKVLLEKEPGDDQDSPYRIPHRVASIAERLVAWWLNVDWDAYNKEVTSL